MLTWLLFFRKKYIILLKGNDWMNNQRNFFYVFNLYLTENTIIQMSTARGKNSCQNFYFLFLSMLIKVIHAFLVSYAYIILNFILKHMSDILKTQIKLIFPWVLIYLSHGSILVFSKLCNKAKVIWVQKMNCSW